MQRPAASTANLPPLGDPSARAAALLPEFARALASGDEHERLTAARGLGDVPTMGKNAEPAVRALALCLKDPSAAVVVACVQGISALGTERDVWMLCAPLIEHKNPKIGVAALESLRRFPSERVAGALEQKLAGGPHVMRMAALSIIESAADEVLVGPLVKALSHPSLAIRNRAAEVAASVARGGKIEMGRTLVWLLRSNDVNVRRTAAQVLASVPDPDGTLWPKLVTSLRDDDWWVRERIMDALVDLAGRGLSQYIVQWLTDASDVVRRFALGVLMRLKDPETITALVQCAQNDTDWWVREKAIEVIAEFKDARAIPVVVEVMQRTPELAVACINALKHIDPTSAAPHVVGLLDVGDADVRIATLKLLEATNDPSHAGAVAPLRQDANPHVARLAHAIVARFRAVRSGTEAAPVPRIHRAADVAALDVLLTRAAELFADDIIIASAREVFAKGARGVFPLTDRPLTDDQVAAMLTPLLSSSQAARLEARRDVDTSYVVAETGLRFRAVVFKQRGGLSAVFRSVRATAPLLADLGLPKIVSEFCDKKNGLVVLAGPAGSGKTTTMAALVDHLNRTRAVHVVSIEDPIEIVHQQHVSLINQREVGTHTKSVAAALRSALRQDPDVLMLGEMVDAETIQLAITAAETGHLVFATLQTTSAEQAVERILAAYPKDKLEQARASVADVLRGVACQILLSGTKEHTRHVACEVFVNNDASANLIRKGKTTQLASLIATSAEVGMQSLESDVSRLVRARLVDPDDALLKQSARLLRAAPLS